ncbi:unnamed protein product [Sordaria macrospora k-hell]|uniref:WGS project CABT00000000 data, contig 2.63 n=1 Tax=Sordaria macrospora (strain ATCC MYA-333 / DSM 997 / K(L3346) / K-hell) TaxID=771870 RepID=F7WAM8_SORMK|nr:uncharacterized protein SMAC_08681 [Sordaria macrospora k-hell]CCC14223.1 unnamed protein product [Sordaria macrospora k-hell]
MQFSTILLSAIAFFAGAEACKCLNSGGGFNKGASEACCHQQNGSWRNGNDCAAQLHLRALVQLPQLLQEQWRADLRLRLPPPGCC